jgi:hypothetical protein
VLVPRNVRRALFTLLVGIALIAIAWLGNGLYAIVIGGGLNSDSSGDIVGGAGWLALAGAVGRLSRHPIPNIPAGFVRLLAVGAIALAVGSVLELVPLLQAPVGFSYPAFAVVGTAGWAMSAAAFLGLVVAHRRAEIT